MLAQTVEPELQLQCYVTIKPKENTYAKTLFHHYFVLDCFDSVIRVSAGPRDFLPVLS